MPQQTPSISAALASLHPGIDSDVAYYLQSSSELVTLPNDTRVFSPGDPCRNFLLVLTGSVKVLQYSASGREIVLYRVQGGESCLLTTASLLAEENYSVTAITESEVTAVTLPAPAFNRALASSHKMRQFVFRNYSKRLADVFVLVNELAFSSLDLRLSQKLLEQADDACIVSMTHQQLAAELGSSREVISRRLKELEQLGWIQLHRGKIVITNSAALQANLAETSS